MFSEESIEKARQKHDKAWRQIRAIEKRLPWFKKISDHPKIGTWLPVAVATGEVLLGFFIFGLFSMFLSFVIPKIPWPDINIPFPDINLPSIPIPHIPFPDINLPPLPEWLKDFLYWMKRTAPIWIALMFAIYTIRKSKEKKTDIEAK